MPQIVYVFTNPVMPNCIKIGMTSQADVEQRLKDLSNPTGVPVPFECLYAAEVENAAKIEAAIHQAFDCDRINPKREFFTTAPHRIIALLKAHAISDVTPATQKILAEITPKADMDAQHHVIAKTRKYVDRLKTRGLQGIAKGIGARNPNPELKRFREQILKNPPTEENANDLREIIANAPKGIHPYRLIALRELVDEAESTTQN